MVAESANRSETAAGRIEKWDNARGLLIILVVLGHVIEPGVNSQGYLRWLFLFIYLFHMPAFFFLSGMFARNAVLKRKFDRAIGYVFLYFAMKMLVFLSKTIVNGTPSAFHVFWEDGVAWYALCMAVFLLISMLARGLKPAYVLIGAILLACFAGYDDAVGDTMAISRIIVFFPFFYTGMMMQEEKLRKTMQPMGLRIAAGVVLAVVFLIVYQNISEMYWIRTLVTGRNPFSKLKMYVPFGGLLRLTFYFAAGLLVWMVLAVVPERRTFLGFLGQRALSVFVLHIPLINVLNVCGLRDRFIGWNFFPSHLIPCILLTVGVLWLCSRRGPYQVCRGLMDVKARNA